MKKTWTKCNKGEQVTVWIPAELKQKLTVQAHQQGCSVSHVIRALIETECDGEHFLGKYLRVNEYQGEVKFQTKNSLYPESP